MSLLNLPKILNSFGNLQKRGVPACLCSKEEFDAILKRERARSDRNGQIFSLVIFDIGNAEAKAGYARDLLRILVRRLRSTDELGWIDKQHIGVILPNTPVDGARIFADAIRKSIAPISPPLHYEIYIYPDDKRKKDNKNHIKEKNQTAESARKTDETNARNFAGFAKQSINGADSLSSHEGSVTAENCPKTMLKIQPLLVREMPVWKRCIDIAGSLFGLLVLSPILLLVSLMIKTVSPGPVFFKQERIGYGGKPFTLWKFRTMNVNVDTSNHQQYLAELINSAANHEHLEKPMVKMDDDPQIIPCGNILRKSCLDELPQLINVLRGEMSLVGPRPPIPYEVEEYLCWYKGRFDIVPGMTGLWQVSGKNRLTFKEMVRLDIQYAKHISFWFDMKILLKTPLAIMMQIMDRLKKQKMESKGVEQNA